MIPDDTISRNNPDSMQSQVERLLQNRIRAGEWRDGERIPSERELAQSLGLSRTTVRNAIQTLTNQGLFDRRIGQGTFVRGSEGSGVAVTQRKGTLGFVVCKPRQLRKPISNEAFYFEVFSGIEEESLRSGSHVLFSYLDERSPEELESFAAFLSKVDGLVLQEARGPAVFDILRTSRVPAVLLAPTAEVPGFDLVTFDLAAGAEKAVKYLLELGHRRIGFISGPLQFASARIRMEAWKKALKEAGMEAREGDWAEATEWSAQAGATAAAKLLKTGAGISAVFCCNDLLAIGALSELSASGRRVPEDLSVLGFDDTVLARHSSPLLSTMKIYAHDMALSAIRRVMERIENQAIPSVIIEFPIDVVARKSCMEVNADRGGQHE